MKYLKNIKKTKYRIKRLMKYYYECGQNIKNKNNPLKFNISNHLNNE